MEKLVQVPFDVKMAKKITEGKVEGSIVTRDGRNVRIICWDKKSITPIVGLVDEGYDTEYTEYYYNNGISLHKHGEEDNDDIFIEIPEYLTFKDGDIFKTSYGSIGIYDANYTPMYGLAPYYVGLRYADEVLCFCLGNEFGFGALRECTHDVTESEKQKLIEALKSSDEPLSKEYLKRFFGI